MWKCHHCKPPPPPPPPLFGNGKVGREGAASQKAIKICDHLFPLPRLIHLSGEWFCPYPPKATNLFCCLSPCIRMNLWNSQTCTLSLLPLPLLLSLSHWLCPLFRIVSFYLSSYSLPLCLWLLLCLSVLTFPLLHRRFLPSFLPLFLSPFHRVRNVYMNPFQIISRKQGATRRLCQWQFNPWWARCM